MSTRNNNQLVFKTFDKALLENPDAKPIFHSDRGFQYTSKIFQRKLKEHSMEQSMSRVGHCIDNGPTEGFWGIIKTEMDQMYEITDESSLRHAIKKLYPFLFRGTTTGQIPLSNTSRSKTGCIKNRHTNRISNSRKQTNQEIQREVVCIKNDRTSVRSFIGSVF